MINSGWRFIRFRMKSQASDGIGHGLAKSPEREHFGCRVLRTHASAPRRHQHGEQKEAPDFGHETTPRWKAAQMEYVPRLAGGRGFRLSCRATGHFWTFALVIAINNLAVREHRTLDGVVGGDVDYHITSRMTGSLYRNIAKDGRESFVYYSARVGVLYTNALTYAYAHWRIYALSHLCI